MVAHHEQVHEGTAAKDQLEEGDDAKERKNELNMLKLCQIYMSTYREPVLSEAQQQQELSLHILEAALLLSLEVSEQESGSDCESRTTHKDFRHKERMGTV